MAYPKHCVFNLLAAAVMDMALPTGPPFAAAAAIDATVVTSIPCPGKETCGSISLILVPGLNSVNKQNDDKFNRKMSQPTVAMSITRID